MRKLQATLDKEFNKEDGPFVKSLDRALTSFNVHRQEYYTGTFVGNHVHLCLKAMGTHFTMCFVTFFVPLHCDSCTATCSDLVSVSQNIAPKFDNA